MLVSARFAASLAPFALLCASGSAFAAAPTGNLDAATPAMIGGWARDADNTGPIAVHIYIDGEIAHAMLANAVRPDLPFADQAHGFTWTPPLLGPGTHQVVVYAIGVNAQGVPDNNNPSLPNSPKNISNACNGFTLSALAWCQGVPNYYVNRAADTTYLFSDTVRAGINASYGGTILELYAADHSRNRLVEHGGGAVQLSIWGYEDKGPAAFFATDTCDPTPFPSEAACLGAGHGACRAWCCSQGAHIANCSSVQSCVGWGAGGPWNPIQAQAANCGWDSPTNDVDSLTTGQDAVSIKKAAPYHFTKSNSMPGINFEETASLMPAGVKLDYRITYTGGYTLTPHPQEIPAIFPGQGIHYSYSYYTGASPYQNASSAVTQTQSPPGGMMFRLKNRDPYPHPNVDAVLTENWVTACDMAQTTCVTVAVFSPQYKEINGAGYPGNGEGYLTPLGGFAIQPGLDEAFTAYLFPYRYDEVVSGKSIRQWIYDIASTQGCLLYGTGCDDGDPCTSGDICQGNGACQGTPDPALCGSASSSSSSGSASSSSSSSSSGGTGGSAGASGGAGGSSSGEGGALGQGGVGGAGGAQNGDGQGSCACGVVGNGETEREASVGWLLAASALLRLGRASRRRSKAS